MRSISKLFVGAAVAGACGYAAAATITGGQVGADYSRPGAATSPGDRNLGTVTVQLADAYVQFDTLRLIPVGASFGTVAAGGHTAAITCSASGIGSLVFNYTAGSSSTSLVVYTAAALPAALTTTSGLSCPIPTLLFAGSSMSTAGVVQVRSESIKASSFATFDVGAARTVATVSEQFSVAVTQTLNGVIDVASSRVTFASGTDAFTGFTGADVFSVSVTNASTQQNPVTAGTLVLTLTAGTSFAFLQDPDGQTGAGSCSVTGAGGAAATVNGSSGTAAVTLSPTSGACNVLTATINTVAGLSYSVALGRTVNATTTNSSVFAPQSYSVSGALTSGTVALASLASTAAGSWTLNGTTADIAYVPINSAVNLQVFVANQSAQEGTVTFTAWNASSNSTCTGTLGTVLPGSTGSFGSALKTALQGCTGTGWSTATRATVQVLSTTPFANTEIHTAFSASDSVSRGLLINSTN